MRLFLSEHCTCGADPSAAAGPLFAEGAAMLRALAADAARIEGVEVVVTWADSLPPFGVSGVEVVEVPAGRPANDAIRRLFWACDRTLHVAPDGENNPLWQWAVEFGTFAETDENRRRWLGCPPWTVSVCGDKLALHEAAIGAGLRRPHAVAGSEPLPFPFVRKPEAGAGGDAVLFRDDDDLAVCPPRNADASGRPIPLWNRAYSHFTEAYVPGRPCSVAVINDSPLPPGEQHITITGSPGRISYHGGTVPAANVDSDAVNRLVAQVRDAVPGLRGWWGIDFVIPDEPFPPEDREGSRDPVLIEVNPRLTTSYLGLPRPHAGQPRGADRLPRA